METVTDYLVWLQNHCRWWLQPWNSKMLAPWKKTKRNLVNALKGRDITLPTKVHLVKAMVFLVVKYGCENWIIKKAECWRTDAFELWCWRRLLKAPWTARRSNQSMLKKINPEYSLEGLMLKLQYSGYLMGKADTLEEILMLRRFEGRKKRERQRTRWLDSISDSTDMNLSKLHEMAKWTEKAGMLQVMGSQTVGHSLATTTTSSSSSIVLVAKSCPTLCDPMDCSPPGSYVHGILQARILEWVAIPFPRGSFQPRNRTCVSCIASRWV